MIKTNAGQQLGFGIELEMGLRPKPSTIDFLASYDFDNSDTGHQINYPLGIDYPGPRDKNRNAIHEFLFDYLECGGINAANNDASIPDYNMWQIVDDPSVIESQNSQGDKRTCIVLEDLLELSD
jgi:hypothetical protein